MHPWWFNTPLMSTIYLWWIHFVPPMMSTLCTNQWWLCNQSSLFAQTYTAAQQSLTTTLHVEKSSTKQFTMISDQWESLTSFEQIPSRRTRTVLKLPYLPMKMPGGQSFKTWKAVQNGELSRWWRTCLAALSRNWWITPFQAFNDCFFFDVKR